jgi:hypothetical protein
MLTETLSLVSVFVAFCAVLVTVWQARRAARDGERMRSLPIVSEVSREWRSREFRQHRRVVLSLSGTTPSEGGFEALPPDIRESVYTWCFFCDYLGQLVLHKIVSEDLIIGFSGTIISQLWGVLEPFIESERHHRIETLPEGVPPGFLPYYEHLVARVAARGGSTAAEKIREKYSVQKLSSEDLRALIPRVDSSEKRHRTVRGWWRHPTALRGDDRANAGDGWVDNGLVFTTRHGAPIGPRNFNRSFDRCIVAARVPRINVHGTRKTCASLPAALDVHPRVAMRILLHSKINVTMEMLHQDQKGPVPRSEPALDLRWS